MFETVVNGLLVRFLGPYVDDLSPDKLNIRFGSFELTDLRLKPNLFATLGVDAVELERGTLKRVAIAVPLSAWISGNINVVVHGLDLVARTKGDSGAARESDEESLQHLRQNRTERIETRAAQIIELRRNQEIVEAARTEGKKVENKASLGAKVARQIVGNTTVDVTQIGVGLRDPVLKSEFGVNLAAAFVRSDDGHSGKPKQQAAPSKLSKEVGFEGLSLVGGQSPNPESLLRPLDFKLWLQHDAERAEVAVSLRVGDGETTGAALSHLQLRMFAATVTRFSQESKRLQQLLTPPGTRELVDMSTTEAVDTLEKEFVDLLRRDRREELNLPDTVPMLANTDAWRLQVLWDVVPEAVLARWVVPVVQLAEEVAKAREAEAAEKAHRASFFGRLFAGSQESASKAEDHEEALSALRVEAEALESLQPPGKMVLELYLLHFDFDLRDHAGDSLLHLAVRGAALGMDVSKKTDYKGVPNAECSLAAELQAFVVSHRAQPILKFGAESVIADLHGGQPSGNHENPALRQSIEQRIEEDRTVLSISTMLEPMDFFWVHTLVPELKGFVDSIKEELKEFAPTTSRKTAMSKSMDQYFSQGEAWLNTEQGQQALTQAKDRIPDALELHISLSGPRMRLPVNGPCEVWISSGKLAAETEKACTSSDMKLQMTFSEMALTVKDQGGISREVVSPFTFDMALALQPDLAECDMKLHSFQVEASPEVAQTLFALPRVLSASLRSKQTEAAPEQSEGSTMARRANDYMNLARQRTKQKFKTNQKFRLSLEIKRLTLLLLDVAAPILRLELGVHGLEVSRSEGTLSIPLESKGRSSSSGDSSKNQGLIPQTVDLNIYVFNTQVGRYEPLLEPLQLAFSLLQTAEDSRTLRLIARRSLLLTARPKTIRLMSWYLPHFASVVKNSLKEAEVEEVTRYRLLNLTDKHIECSFGAGSERVSMAPTGADWIALDSKVLEARAEEIRLKDGSLNLHQACSTRVLGTWRLVQLLRPRVEYALVLVSWPVLFLNETSLPVELRFLGAAPLSRANCADISVLHGEHYQAVKLLRQLPVSPDPQHASSEGARLHPGEFASIAVDNSVAREDDRFQISWEVLPSGGVWSDVQKPRSKKSVPVQCGSMCLLAIYEDVVSAPPAELQLLHVRLLPPLQFVSGLPCPVFVEYRLSDEAEKAGRIAKIEGMGATAVYEVPTSGHLAVRFRFESGPWTDWGHVQVGSSEATDGTDMELSIAGEEGTSTASLAVASRGMNEITVHCPSWMVDRTGWNLTLKHYSAPLPAVDGIHFCAGLDGYSLSMEAMAGPVFSLPTGSTEWQHAHLADHRAICVRSSKVPHEETQGCSVRCLELLPCLILKNASDHPVEFKVGQAIVEVLPGASVAPASGLETIRFRPLPGDGTTCSADWSYPVPAQEGGTGALPYVVGSGVWTVEVRPDSGVLCVLLQSGSTFSVQNALDTPCEVLLRGMPVIAVPPGEDRELGWLDPCGADAKRTVTLRLPGSSADDSFDPRVAQVRPLGPSAHVVSSLHGSGTCLKVQPIDTNVQRKRATQAEIQLPKLGVSLVGEEHELLYLEMELLRISAVMRPEDDVQLLDISVADAQLDWQSAASDASAVVLGNRGGSSTSSMNPFFRMVAERGRTSSPDLNLRAIRIQIDEVEVSIDERLLSSMKKFVDDSKPTSASKDLSTVGGTVAKLQRSAGRAILDDDWVIPPARKAVQIDQMYVSAIILHVWCHARLAKLAFVPKWVRKLLSGMSLSNVLALEGATVSLSLKEFTGVHGSVLDVVKSLGREYTHDLLRSVSSVLGNSSLLTLPRAPLKLGAAVIGQADSAVSKVNDSTASVIEFMTLDEEYVERQKQLRQRKQISNFGQGVTEAMSDLGDGFQGMLDVVRKPVAGARATGFGGFVEGVGKGVASGFVKPLNAIGQAVHDVGRGAAASVCSAVSKKRHVTCRRRLPRMLAGPLRAVVEYSDLDAWVALRLGGRRLEAIVPLLRAKTAGNDDGALELGAAPSTEEIEQHTLLLLIVMPDGLLILETEMPELMEESDDAALLSCLTPTALNVEALRSQTVLLEMPAGEAEPRLLSPDAVWHSNFPLSSVEWQELQTPGAQPQLALLPGGPGEKPRFLSPVPWELGKDLVQSLFAVLSLAKQTLQGDWAGPLRMALSRARNALAKTDPTEVVEVCEVWEVERAEVAAGTKSRWRQPFLPGEVEQRHRWLDETLQKRHPLLDPTVDHSRASEPPIVMQPIWTACVKWKVQKSEQTDGDGWQYATNWSASAWGKTPRALFDSVRRRRWQREYQLNMSREAQFIDSDWLHGKRRKDESWFDLFCMSCCARRTAPAMKIRKDSVSR